MRLGTGVLDGMEMGINVTGDESVTVNASG
jgi:hypothetical protein